MRKVSSFIIVILSTLHDASSFHILSSSFFGSVKSRKLVTLSASTSPSSPFSKGIDLERARECVGTSGGVCDLEEMEQLRDALKAERMKDFLSSSLFYLYPTGAPSSPWNPNDSLEKRLLEDNLSHQLQLLKKENEQHHQAATSSAFVQSQQDTMTKRQDFIPHAATAATTDTASSVPTPQGMNDMIEFLTEPSTEEMMTVCFVVAMMMIFPFLQG
uniref:Uncharacterized protein n=1 Tax=Helicotheca tamesis TaxID=374047 RepID=A0A7S2N385_9STRA|mmetsp:Transcript_8937/g.12372  ORF Transcript_8937/g.12372 Transcript_8937/m.12372 type:complete len:216 (+) Transcript_8937:47-694(+)|eukprot:CAMPEP_0185729702 /NCGR_PEP_ID=MMETSP1171-20130828/6988_1 /TAXON_ID=374046 /ORGANISM="Helicotheca tamensis, Strain CCMP826" /LENGTH=215 /DNA_ID=CAMNT_0028398603 /DNA_START=10 /DNA_END=657 /DNA_ORIENTATION=+